MSSDTKINASVVGYCDRLDYRPGDTVNVHVHGDGPVAIDLVRLNTADDRVEVCMPLETAVEVVARQQVIVQPQVTRPGSFALVEGMAGLSDASTIEIELWLYPTLLGHGTVQGILSTQGTGNDGFALVLNAEDRLELRVAAGGRVVKGNSDKPLLPRTWTRVKVRLSFVDITFVLKHETKPALPRGLGACETREKLSLDTANWKPGSFVLIGGGLLHGDAGSHPFAEQCFNGKIEAVRVSAAGRSDAAPTLLAAWDFAQGIESDRIIDVSGNERHGRLYNAPARAVTGHDWTGDEVDFRHVPEQYAAIHFHDDDLEDARWQRTASITLPQDLESGIYAVRVVGEGGADRVPVFVLPGKQARKRDIAFLVPTFTYQAYANAALGERIDYRGSGISGRNLTPGARDRQLAEFPELRGSLYDIHSDGSGRFYSSFRRPILNLRPDYLSAVQQAPRHLGGDLYLTGWLTHRGYGFDTLTDHALDLEPDVLSGYRVLITGSHPEYWSGRMLSRLEAFIAAGGRVMYLGGNGFYWVTSQDPTRPQMVECRRGYAGIRTWTSEPGELHFSTTGEPGGLWRHRGRAPNRLVGIGMASQGWDERAPGFRKTDAGRASEHAWVFEGVEGDVFGDAGLVMDGASGDELDRYDVTLGSPRHAHVLATSLPHSRYYKLAVEDVSMMVEGLGGDTDERVRSDMVLFDWPSGGAVFSVGSIAWAGALAWNNFDNSVERVTRNVLDRFLKPEFLSESPRV